MPTFEIKSQQQFYQDWKNAAQAIDPTLTDFNAGSELDALAGATSEAGNEFSRLVSDAFNKTFFETADGPEITGGPDDLQSLAVDHFGSSFARPGPQPAQGIVTFSRASTGLGNVTINTGTIVKTVQDANGGAQRFATVLPVLMTGLSINASVQAVVSGVAGDVEAHAISVIETALTDGTVHVDNGLKMVGGADTLDDSAYREYIYNLIQTIRGATLDAIRAKALTIPGVVEATAIEIAIPVKQWDIGGNTTVGSYFYLPRASLYISDANGSADAALILAVQNAIFPVKAAGVIIDVFGATPIVLDWISSVVFNPMGPNFASLSIDSTPIVKTMKTYLNTLPIGTGFVRSVANLAIMAIWGPAGTNDLTSFVTDDPVGDVAATASTKIVAGSVSTL